MLAVRTGGAVTQPASAAAPSSTAARRPTLAPAFLGGEESTMNTNAADPSGFEMLSGAIGSACWTCI